MPIATTNPATGEVLRTFAALSALELEARLGLAADAFALTRTTTYAQRAEWMRRAADILARDTSQVARMMTTEMGKTFASAQAEVAKCAVACRFYAEHSERFLADELVEPTAVNAHESYVRYEPLGVVLAIMPWNFPLWQAMRFAAPALMAGNVALLKHSSNVPQTALFLQDLFAEAGFPAAAFQTLLIGADQVEQVLSDKRVAAVTLTGSEAAGRSVAAIAGYHLKKTVLELGGSDAFIVMPSADIERAAQTAATARCQNNGQSCIAAKRFLVHTDIYDDFATAFVKRMTELIVGNPMDPDTDVGPMATRQGRDDLAAQVKDATDRGASILCGGAPIDRPGWWYPPTVVADLTPEMSMYADEVFGPVAALHRIHSYDEAIEIANGTDFGLGSNAWTTLPAEQTTFIADLQAGAVFINGMTTSFNELPFGGIKNSGYGRELSLHGIKEFCNIKAVWLGNLEPGRAGAHSE